MRDLDGIDERLEAHLDGLHVGGADGWRLACDLFAAHHEDGEAFLLLSLAAADPQDARLETALSLLMPTLSVLESAGAHTLAWLPATSTKRIVQRGLLHADPICRRMALRAAFAHGHDPDCVTQQIITSQRYRECLARAIQAVGELGRVDLYAACRPHLTSDDIPVRFWTSWTLALRTASGESRKTLQWFATARSPFAVAAAALAARRLAPLDAQAWIDLLATTHPRLAIQAAGAAGDPVRLPWLLERCADPALARVSGEAISLITGVDLAYLDLDGDQPADFTPPGPTDDPADPNVDTDPDEHLPWPDVAKLSRWLAQQSFPVGVRHLCGKPIEAAWCQQVLRDGYQRQRLAAAHELAAIDPTAPLFNTAAPAWVQRKLLG